jgi:drug/metabolite transporter (DMT)-like permease
MPPALLTAFFFALTAVCARRAALLLGAAPANFARLLLAALLLGIWAHMVGAGLGGGALGWFLLSGLAGFGVGGLTMFHALPRAGSNLAMLIVQCGTALVAATLEWFWLGTRLSGAQIGCAVLVLAGVALGLLPRNLPGVPRRVLWTGIALAALSACGQGAGAVLSRRAFAELRAAGGMIDPGSAAYQRVLGGLLVALIGLAWWCWRRRGAAVPARPDWRRAAPWVGANTLSGPVLGVTAYQWALSLAPAGVVQSIVATAPLLTAPLAWRLGEATPRPLYFAGAALAVAGTAGLFWTAGW